MREDSRFVDQLFKNLSIGDQQQIRNFVKSNVIELVLNYPRSQLAVPAIVILLKSESESQAFLSDFMGLDDPEELSYDGDVGDEVLGGTASLSTMSNQGLIVFGPHRVLSATNNTIKVSDKTFVPNSYINSNDPFMLHLVAGTGAGQIRGIKATSHNTVMVAPNWQTLPDTTSVFEIRKVAEEVLGEPAKLYDRRSTEFVERKGAYYTNRYQVQLVGNNQESTIYLYVILKAIFTLSRLFMEKQGLINFQMSGTDFVNRPEYIPDYAFMRTMNIEFLHPFSTFAPMEGLIESFTFCLNNDVGTVAFSTPVQIGPDEAVITGP